MKSKPEQNTSTGHCICLVCAAELSKFSTVHAADRCRLGDLCMYCGKREDDEDCVVFHSEPQ